MKTTVHDTKKTMWGYETLATVIDDNGDTWCECITTPAYPKTQDEIITAAETNVSRRLAFKAAEILEPDISTLEEQKAILEAEIVILEAEKAVLEKDVSDLEAAKAVK